MPIHPCGLCNEWEEMTAIKCDGTLEEHDYRMRDVCPKDATFWEPRTKLCCCDDHREGRTGLERLWLTMPPDIQEETRERQALERSTGP